MLRFRQRRERQGNGRMSFSGLMKGGRGRSRGIRRSRGGGGLGVAGGFCRGRGERAGERAKTAAFQAEGCGTRLRVHREAGRLVRHKYPRTQSVSKTKKVTRAIFALPKLFPMIQGECETNRVEDCAPLSGGRP